jgi:hypothetical protein
MSISKIQFPTEYREFNRELRQIINGCSMENRSNTPDFVLADMLTTVLMQYDIAIARRKEFRNE